MKLNKILHNVNYWTNGYYMIGYDLAKSENPLVVEFRESIIKLLKLKEFIKWLTKKLN